MMEVTIKIKIENDEVKDVQVVKVRPDEEPYSEFARIWDRSEIVTFFESNEQAMLFLASQERYANTRLKAKGHLFLNEVYEMLGLPKTKAGQTVGWVYTENTHVSFGLDDPRCSDFVNGIGYAVLLDFNVDGDILDAI